MSLGIGFMYAYLYKLLSEYWMSINKESMGKMKDEQAEKSYYFHINGDKSDNWDHKQEGQDVTLAGILQQMQKNHHQVLNRIDSSDKLEQLQRKLSDLITQKFNELAERLGKLETKTNGQQAQKMSENASPLRAEGSEGPYFRFLQDHQEEDQQREQSRMINIYEYQLEPAPEEFSEMIALHRDTAWEEGDAAHDLKDTSSILQQFMTTFQEMNLQLTECIKIYDFPEMSSINFHEVMDKKNNILFLAELHNNEVVGAFTHLPFSPQPNYIPRENSKSFLCNLTRGHFAFAARVNKTHTHDENYLIFGNWEIKVRWREHLLQTNWGTNGDCFKLKKYGGSEKLTLETCDFFGKGAQQKSLRMKRYNIYTFS